MSQTLLNSYDQFVPASFGMCDRFVWLPDSGGQDYVPLSACRGYVYVPGNKHGNWHEIAFGYNAETNMVDAFPRTFHDPNIRPGDSADMPHHAFGPLDIAKKTRDVQYLIFMARELGVKTVAPATKPAMPVFMLGFDKRSDIPVFNTPALREATIMHAGISQADFVALDEKRRNELLAATMAANTLSPDNNPTGMFLVSHFLFGDADFRRDPRPIFGYYGYIQGEYAYLPSCKTATINLPVAEVAQFAQRFGVPDFTELLDLARTPAEELIANMTSTDAADLQRFKSVVTAFCEHYFTAADYAAVREALVKAYPTVTGTAAILEGSMADAVKMLPASVFGEELPRLFEQASAQQLAMAWAPYLGRPQVVLRETSGMFRESMTFSEAQVTAKLVGARPRGRKRGGKRVRRHNHPGSTSVRS